MCMIQNVKLEEGSCYCVTFNTVDWVDVFIRPVYKQIIVHTLNHFIDSGKVTVYGWCLMTNHLHLLVHPINGSIADFEKEFKSFTTRKILEAINTEPLQRRKWMLQRFEEFCKVFGLVKKYNVWQNSSRPLYIDFENVLLPQPEGPITDKNSPFAISRLIPVKANVSMVSVL